MKQKSVYLALFAAAALSLGAVSLHNKGIEFDDGSFQSTAASLTASTAVQGKVSLGVVGLADCTTTATLYSVPANKRLVIEWMALETALFGGAASTHPVDVRLTVHNGMDFVTHTVARLENPTVIGTSFFLSANQVKEVKIYSEAGQDVTVYMCLDQTLEDEGVGTVAFSGYLIDV